jgi:hypothetical protein
MVNLDAGRITLDGTSSTPIEKWDVWFMTPFGVFDNLAAAVKRCKGSDLDPEMTIIPVPVAISGTQTEIVRR